MGSRIRSRTAASGVSGTGLYVMSYLVVAGNGS
jgi:hypothetical protein